MSPLIDTPPRRAPVPSFFVVMATTFDQAGIESGQRCDDGLENFCCHGNYF
jgi:hypothetical protein